MINVFHSFFYIAKLPSHFPLYHRQHLVRYCCVGCWVGQAFSTSLRTYTKYISMDPSDSPFSILWLSVVSYTKIYPPSAIRLCSSTPVIHPPKPLIPQFLSSHFSSVELLLARPFITQLGSCQLMKINLRRKSVVQTRRHLNLVDHASGSQVNFCFFFFYYPKS